MIKTFISHSSVQKQFAKNLVELLGRDLCYLDCYDFRPADKTMDEIYKCIDKSTFFVLLISKESLKSEWVEIEVKKAVSNMERNRLKRFLPYIIDERVTINDIPEWITKEECFNLKYFRSPQVVKKDIKEKIRNIIWSDNPKIRERETFFVGRNKEIDSFQNYIYSARASEYRAVIISGRKGVGKTRFAKHCLSQLGATIESDPYQVSLSNKNGIEDFIIQLNSLQDLFSKEELENRLSGDKPTKVNTAVMLLNEVYKFNDYLFVYDNMSCVLPTQNITEWLIDVVSNEDLNNHIGLFILSRITPKTFVSVRYKELIHIPLLPLDREDRKKFFFKCAQVYDLAQIPKTDAEFFINRLVYSPYQLEEAVKAISSHGLMRTKRDIDSFVQFADIDVRPIIEHFSTIGFINILILLSKVEFLSIEVLDKVFETDGVDMQQFVTESLSFGIIELFGYGDEFVRLDHSLADYIQRNRMVLPQDVKSCFEEIIENSLADSSDITEDVSIYLYETRQRILEGRIDTQFFLIPSVIIKAVIDLYNKRDWVGVITLCDKVLKDAHNYYDEILRELRYWECLALCRIQDEKRFFDNVRGIDGADNFFLKGFYFRNAKDYPSAEKMYNIALEKNSSLQKAKRELVTVYLARKKYSEALQFAKENYESRPDNTYHIQAYFRCLVRQPSLAPEEKRKLESLINDIKRSYSSKKDSLAASMELQYDIYIKRKNPGEIFDKISELKKTYPDSVDINRVIDEFNVYQKVKKIYESYEEDD